MNKTGTTSLSFEFQRLNIRINNQHQAERLFDEYMSGNEMKLFNYCNEYTFFQDVPFSIPNVYKSLDVHFPNSKFILTIRNSADEWYESLLRFHTITSNIPSNGNLPTADDLKKSNYIRAGWLFDVHTTIFGVSENNLYDRNILINAYNNHITDVLEYFKDRSNDLLVLNLGKDGSYNDFTKFINVSSPFDKFPHKNKSK